MSLEKNTKTRMFIGCLLKQKQGRLRIQLSSAKNNPDFMMYSDDKTVLDNLSKSIGNILEKQYVVWNIKNPAFLESEKVDLVGDNKYHLWISVSNIDEICRALNLPFGSEQLILELKQLGAQLVNGYRTDNKDKHEIDFSKNSFSSEFYEIQNLIKKLEREIDSCWPYPNKDRKFVKVKFLRSIIDHYKEFEVEGVNIKDSLDWAIETDPNAYHQVMLGRFSTRTRDLIESILWSEDRLSLEF